MGIVSGEEFFTKYKNNIYILRLRVFAVITTRYPYGFTRIDATRISRAKRNNGKSLKNARRYL